MPTRGRAAYAYRYSEARAAHWLLLMLAHRVDVLESRVTGLLRGMPDNPVTEMGLRTELTRNLSFQRVCATRPGTARP